MVCGAQVENLRSFLADDFFGDSGAATNDVEAVFGVGNSYTLKIEVFGFSVFVNHDVGNAGSFSVVVEAEHCAGFANLRECYI